MNIYIYSNLHRFPSLLLTLHLHFCPCLPSSTHSVLLKYESYYIIHQLKTAQQLSVALKIKSILPRRTWKICSFPYFHHISQHYLPCFLFCRGLRSVTWKSSSPLPWGQLTGSLPSSMCFFLLHLINYFQISAWASSSQGTLPSDSS